MYGRPMLRGFCHCTICQAFNQAPYADITLFRARDVAMPAPDLVEYRAYRKPPALQRGKCIACGGPALEFVQVFPRLKLIIVPSGNILDAGLVPRAALHIFYDRRLADFDDDLPKYTGYWRSQLAFGRKLMASLI